MTKDEVLALEAGREMDALIATHIFGLVWWKRGVGAYIALPPEDKEIPIYWEQVEPPTSLAEDMLSENVPYWSTSVADAWKVVEKVNLFRDYHLGQYLSGSTWVWSVEKHEATEYEGRCIPAHRVLAMGETFPLAVCRAALMAVSQ